MYPKAAGILLCKPHPPDRHLADLAGSGASAGHASFPGHAHGGFLSYGHMPNDPLDGPHPGIAQHAGNLSSWTQICAMPCDKKEENPIDSC